ncbi:MAG TPA: hypothetical protein VI072_08525 [Polyangiaceae bacterium]
MAVRPSERQLVAEIAAALAAVLEVRKGKVKVVRGGAPDADVLVQAAGHTFVVDVLRMASPGPVAAHAERVVAAAKKLRRKATPLLAVPYMTDAGRRAAQGARVSWFGALARELGAMGLL